MPRGRASTPARRPRSRGVPLASYLRRQVWRRRLGALGLAIALTTGAWADHSGCFLYDPDDQLDGHWFNVVEFVDPQTLLLTDAVRGDPFGVSLLGLAAFPPPQAAVDGSAVADRHAQSLARHAARLAREACGGGPVRVRLNEKPRRGDEGQALTAHLPDGSVLNERILEAGLARADRARQHEGLERYVQLERGARRAQTGAWRRLNEQGGGREP